MAKILTKAQTRHGYHGTKVYKLWCDIVKRCETESSNNYEHYGGRGIKVCDEWRRSPKDFCEWALKNGYSSGLTIDRINVDKWYCPENVQFITHKENCASGKRRIYKSNKTGHVGININKHNSFEVYKTINGKQKYLGCRKSIEEALKLRDNEN
jgi:hypothetical protein